MEQAKEGIRTGREAAEDTVGKLQRNLGEDYYAILNENPIVKETMQRAALLTRDEALLSTAFNIPWVTTLMWSAAAGSIVALGDPIAKLSGELAHYGPGHVKAWDEVSKFMDSVSGSGHRLKFGHSIDYLAPDCREIRD